MGILGREGGPVPVTLLGGFLGAGKTTLLNRLIDRAGSTTSGAPGLRFGVLVNDFGAINIDEKLIASAADGVVSLSNGCVCCTIRGDLGRALFQLLERASPPEHVLVEASGVSNPGALVDTFRELARTGLVRLDGVITVVDALHFEGLDRGPTSPARCQVLAADLLVVTKVDLAGEARAAAVEAELRALVPGSRIVRAVHGDVPVELLLSTAPGSAPGAGPRPGLRRGRLAALAPPEASSTAHGFGTFTFTSGAPLSFARLAAVLRSLPPELYRAKGILSLVERPGDRLVFHVVGQRLDVCTIDPFPEGQAPLSELVFIGRAGFDEGALRDALSSCECPAPAASARETSR